MSLKLYECLKSLLFDVESFLLKTLQGERLSDAACSEKKAIVRKLKALQDEYPQLRNFESTSTSEHETATSPTGSPRQQTKQTTFSDSGGDPSEIYSAIGDEAELESSTSQSSEGLGTSLTSVSASEAFANCGYSGTLVRKNPGKSKVDLKSMILLVRGKQLCIVKDGLFYIFEKMTSKKPTGSFPLQGYEARLSAEQPSKKEFLFEVNCPGRKSYLFSSSSSEEIDKWIDVINTESRKAPVVKSVGQCSAKDSTSSSSSAGDDYEDPDDEVTPAVTSLPAADDDDDDDLYDDVGTDSPPLVQRSLTTTTTTTTNNSNISSSARRPAASVADDDDDDHEVVEDDLIYECCDDMVTPPLPSNPAMTSEANMAAPASEDYANMYYGRCDCSADGQDELAFRRGDVVLVLSRQFDEFGWWVGALEGRVGLVPRDYLSAAYHLIST